MSHGVRLSVVVVAELRYGADHSARRRAIHARIDALIEEIETLDRGDRQYRGVQAREGPQGRELAGVAHTAAGSSGVPDHLGARFSQPDSVTATVSSWRMPNSP